MTQSESNERKLILILCLLAAIHTFIFSAAFPFFTMIDEQSHFDLVMKYSSGSLPHGLEPIADASTNYFVTYDSHEYFYPRSMKIPNPSWVRSVDSIAPSSGVITVSWPPLNYEAGQPPLYYAIGGLWWHLGETCGFAGGHLLYWLRFLNILFVAALVWLGYLAARIVFPENAFVRVGVPALLAFFPQAAFYSIENDVLSPLCFGAAFILVFKFLRAETPGVGIGVATGLTLAATFLVKMTNLPMLIVSVLAVLLKIRHLALAGRLRLSTPSLTAMALCAGLPMIAWMAWCKHAFGDLTGSEGKAQYLGWTHKPFVEWWHHPIFTLDGAWTFLSGLTSGFCQGDFWWRCQPLESPVTDAIYVVTSFAFFALAVWGLLSQRNVTSTSQRQALWLGLGCCAAAVAFLGLISIIYDFNLCIAPSREYPYFTAGRTILGVLIPFLMLYLYGLDFLLQSVRNRWVRPTILVGMILFMFVSEIASDWPVFSSQYNWFHMCDVRF